MSILYAACFVAVVLIVYILVTEIIHRTTTYYKVTKNSRLKTILDKGLYGEYLVWRSLQGMEQQGGKFLFNVYLPRDHGRTTEIDVLLICPQGLFVFESKNYSGWIFGSENSRYWTQSLPSGRRSVKNRFLNPVHQNKLHIRCLQELIGKELPVHSIIVFSDRCELKKLEINMQGDVHIVKLGYLPGIVSGIRWTAPLSADQIGKLYAMLLPYSQVSKDIKNAHVAQLRAELNQAEAKPVNAEQGASQAPAATVPDGNIISVTVVPITIHTGDQKDEPGMCPRCGGTLVLRTAKRGPNAGQQFYGCSNYPKCRYTRKIDS